MKLSQNLWQTYKEVPSDAEIPSHRLMIRAGLIHKSGAGLYNYLPFCLRSIQKVERIVREEMERILSQEILMSVVTPGDLWQESGRWQKMGEMLKFKDKKDGDLCISPTNEEAVTDIFRNLVKSYKQLPVSLFQINTKFRDEIRPRFGLMRGREFIMKDAYTFHEDMSCLDSGYQKMYEAYSKIFERIGLEFMAVEADAGAMASSECKTHEFQVIADTGEDVLVYCPENNYAANLEKAETVRSSQSFLDTNEKIEEVSTPRAATIIEVSNLLKTPEHQSLKSMVYAIEKEELEFVLILLLGDDEINNVKLEAVFSGETYRPAKDAELEMLGMVKGYIGPIGLKKPVTVLVDRAVPEDKGFIVGSNKKDFHLKNVILNRDVNEYKKVDLRLSRESDFAADGKTKIQIRKGIEVGHIFQLGDKYSKSMKAAIQGKDGKPFYPLMGCYGIGISRIVAAAIEQHHDEKGIIWPKAIAPYQIHFIHIGKDEAIKLEAEAFYEKLISAGFEVIFDDRKLGPGFKFKDADLLGLPLRITFGEREWKESKKFELVERKTGNEQKLTEDELMAFVNVFFRES
jgi:prolyl-tRNA synthetase